MDMPKCRTLTCAKSPLPDCPAECQLRDEAGNLISCYNPHRDDKNSIVAMSCSALRAQLGGPCLATAGAWTSSLAPSSAARHFRAC